MREDDRELALPVEGPRIRQALVQNTTERVDVGATVDLPALDLLGRDVVDRAHKAALAGQAAHRGHVSRQAEVAEVRVLAGSVLGDKDVAGLHVPVHEPDCVRCIEGPADLPDQIDCALRIEPSFPLEQLAQVGALDVLHRKVEDAVLITRRDGPDDVRMIETPRKLGFTQEALAEAFVARQLRSEELQSHATPA